MGVRGGPVESAHGECFWEKGFQSPGQDGGIQRRGEASTDVGGPPRSESPLRAEPRKDVLGAYLTLGPSADAGGRERMNE